MENNSATMDTAYFDHLMERGIEEGADPTLLDDGRKAFKFAGKDRLRAMLTSTPEEFYKNFAELACSAALDSRTDKSAFRAFFSKAEALKKDKVDAHGFLYNGVRFIAATLLGLVKFAWDLTFISVAFSARFAVRLAKNIGQAVVKTCKETKDDGTYAMGQISESFGRNVLGKTNKSRVETPPYEPSIVTVTL